MKKLGTLIFIPTILSVLILSGCSSQPTNTTSTTPPEFSLGITLDQLANNFNSLSNGKTSMKITNLDKQNSNDGIAFQEFLTDDILLIGKANPDNSVRYVSLMQNIKNPQENAMNDILASGFLIDAVVFNGKTDSNLSKILGNLGLLSPDSANFDTINNKTVYGDKSIKVFSLKDKTINGKSLKGDIDLLISEADDPNYN